MSTLSLALALLIVMVIASETFALKCWHCSSDASNSEFCQKELNPSLLTPEQRRWRFVDCPPPKNPLNVYGQKQVSKCRKQMQIIVGRKVYSRHCVIEAENVDRHDCRGRPVLEGIKILACETCQEDGCNADITALSEEDGYYGDNMALSKKKAKKTKPSIRMISVVFRIALMLF